jgi:hypothetical protein
MFETSRHYPTVSHGPANTTRYRSGAKSVLFDSARWPASPKSHLIQDVDKMGAPPGCEQTAYHSRARVGQLGRFHPRSRNVLSKNQRLDSSLWNEPSWHGGTSNRIRFFGSLVGKRSSRATLSDAPQLSLTPGKRRYRPCGFQGSGYATYRELAEVR